MLLYLNDYKGKYFVLSDTPDDMIGDIGTMDSDDITDDWLFDHVDACVYFGIPAYIGNDQGLKQRVDELYKNFE